MVKPVYNTSAHQMEKTVGLNPQLAREWFDTGKTFEHIDPTYVNR